MRCNNCGWDNDPGTGVCIKCGHTLQAEAASNDPYGGVKVPNYQGGEASPRPTVINAQRAEPAPRPTRIVNSGDFGMGSPGAAPAAQPQAPLNATVAQQPVQAQHPAACPHCGYPLAGNASSCPNCGAELAAQQPQPAPAPQPIPVPTPQSVASAPSSQPKNNIAAELGIDEEVKCEKCGTMVSLDFTFCPKCGERIHLPTVRAIKHKPTPAPEPPKPHCSLTIIPEEEEQIEAVKQTYEGDSIILNRENTEKDNRTITSKEQAELICEDGTWYVLNRSELGSTYIEANRKIALEPGDVLVLGDRRFKFEAE